MGYFATLPKIIITDQSGNQTLAVNLLARADIIPNLLNNPQLFYQYNTQSTDTVEGIANRYYKDPYSYWMLMYGNNLLDPQWDFALSDLNFNNYLNDKYAAAAASNNQTVLAYTQSTIYEYQIVVSTIDSVSQTTTINTYPTSAAQYANTPSSTVTTTFPDGSTVTVITQPETLSIYNYEYNLNEAKRNISIIDKNYAPTLKSALQTLMST